MMLCEIAKFNDCYQFAGFLNNMLRYCTKVTNIDSSTLKEIRDTLSDADNKDIMFMCILKNPALNATLIKLKTFVKYP